MWSDAIYLQFPNEAAARTAATAIGMAFDEGGAIPCGSENYGLVAPMQPPWATEPVVDSDGELVTPGVAEPGYWAMLRLNMAAPSYAATMAALQASGAIRDLTNPPLVWA